MSNKLDFWYLASPYSKYPLGHEAAFQEIAKQAGELMALGLYIYCPIAHSHPICVNSPIAIDDYDVWLPNDKAVFQYAKGMLVCKMDTWETSHGVQWEIKEFTGWKKPIWYFFPGEATKLVEAIKSDEVYEIGG